MVDWSIALGVALAALVVLAAPVSADSASSPGESPSGGGSQSGNATAPEPSGNGSSAPSNSTAGGSPAASQPASQPSTAQCRVAALHIGDPRISPVRWVTPDPDGCVRQAIYRVVSGQPPYVRYQLSRLPGQP